MLAGGSWCLESKVLKAVRQSIYDNIDEYREIVEDPAFKQYFPVIGENHLKTAPKGFPKDFEYIDYLDTSITLVSVTFIKGFEFSI